MLDNNKKIEAIEQHIKKQPNAQPPKLEKGENIVLPVGFGKQRSLAFNTTDSRILAELAKSETQEIRYIVALNANTDSKTLNELASSEYWWIREAVAHHNNTSAKTLYNLKNDKSWIVKWEVVQNKNTTVETLNEMKRNNNDEDNDDLGL